MPNLVTKESSVYQCVKMTADPTVSFEGNFYHCNKKESK